MEDTGRERETGAPVPDAGTACWSMGSGGCVAGPVRSGWSHGGTRWEQHDARQVEQPACRRPAGEEGGREEDHDKKGGVQEGRGEDERRRGAGGDQHGQPGVERGAGSVLTGGRGADEGRRAGRAGRPGDDGVIERDTAADGGLRLGRDRLGPLPITRASSPLSGRPRMAGHAAAPAAPVPHRARRQRQTGGPGAMGQGQRGGRATPATGRDAYAPAGLELWGPAGRGAEGQLEPEDLGALVDRSVPVLTLPWRDVFIVGREGIRVANATGRVAGLRQPEVARSPKHSGVVVTKSLHVAWSIVLTLLFCSGAYAGDWDCTEETLNQPQRTATWFGLDLDTPYKVRVDGVPFVVPVGYLRPWLGPDPERDLTEWRDASQLNFAFWMPSLRHPEHNRLNVPMYHPCEPGREPPGLGEFVVVVDLDDPFNATKSDNYVSPSLRLEKLLQGRVQGIDYEIEEYFGLTKYISKNPYFVANTYDSFYGYNEENIMDVFIRCSPRSRLNPTCSGFVLLDPLDLGYSFRFSISDLESWREVLSGIEGLITKWRIP